LKHIFIFIRGEFYGRGSDEYGVTPCDFEEFILAGKHCNGMAAANAASRWQIAGASAGWRLANPNLHTASVAIEWSQESGLW
jgi:hypothetical protein